MIFRKQLQNCPLLKKKIKKKHFFCPLLLTGTKATTGNTKSAKTVLKNSQYDVNVCYKLSENNIGIAEKIITIPYYMTFLL